VKGSYEKDCVSYPSSPLGIEREVGGLISNKMKNSFSQRDFTFAQFIINIRTAERVVGVPPFKKIKK
jgi:hypothetical protein